MQELLACRRAADGDRLDLHSADGRMYIARTTPR
jgi:hypothetical protein